MVVAYLVAIPVFLVVLFTTGNIWKSWFAALISAGIIAALLLLNSERLGDGN